MYYAPFYDARNKKTPKEELGVFIGYQEDAGDGEGDDMGALEHLVLFLKDYFSIDDDAELDDAERERRMHAHPYFMVNGNSVTLAELIQILEELMETPTLVEIGFLYIDAPTFHAYKVELDQESDEFRCVKECYEEAMENFFPIQRH